MYQKICACFDVVFTLAVTDSFENSAERCETVKDTGTIKRKSGSGIKKDFVRRHLVKKVKDALNKNPKISVRTLANKFKTSASTKQRVKRNCGYKSYKDPGHQYYSAINRKKLNSKLKFAKKFLVWHAICECEEKSSCMVNTETTPKYTSKNCSRSVFCRF